MYNLKMCQRTIILLLLVSSTYSQFFDFYKLKSYVKFFDVRDLYTNDTGNTLWQGILKDCSKKTSFSCIQKNVYTYLDDTFTDRENITVFDGFYMTKNNLDYHKYSAEYNKNERENDVDEGEELKSDESGDQVDSSKRTDDDTPDIEENYVERLSPLEEVTNAIHDKAIEFLATRNYELQLPSLFFEGASIKVSPKEVDEDGALIRVDFKQRELSTQGRFFKKIKKFIQGKLVTSFLALLLIIKLIKIKFMFIIPFLFGVGTAKKLFLKLLLFLIPAFAHVFKLCSSYYSSGTKYHHHHHQIAHHHHHVPVPVPIPAYHDHHPHHHESEDFDGYDYTQPHIQYRKDVEELKEWGIEPYDDPGVVAYGPYVHVDPTPGRYGMPQYAANARPVNVPVPNHLGPFEKYVPQMKYDKPPGPYENPNPNIRHTLNNFGMPQSNKNQIGPKVTVSNLGPIGNHAQNLAYNAYLDDVRLTRATSPVTESNLPKGHHQLFNTQTRPGSNFQKSVNFAPKSDNTNTVDNWFGATSGIAENAFRGQQVTHSTIKSPVFVQASPTMQTYGQALSAATQNLIKPFQHPSNALPNSQHTIQHPLALNPSSVNVQNPVYNHQQQSQKKTNNVEIVKQELPDVTMNNQVRQYDDEYYGPILGRLDEIFKQLRFAEEVCRERLICSMYKNPANYTPHSNLVSNELSREPEELRQGNRESVSGRRFQRYLNAARTGQDGGDCPRLYACYISTK